MATVTEDALTLESVDGKTSAPIATVTEEALTLESGDGTTSTLNTSACEYDILPIPSIDEEHCGVIHEQQEMAMQPSQSKLTRTLQFMWRQHVQSRTPDNRYVQTMLERLFLLFLFFSQFVEGPLNYILGVTPDSENKTTAPKPKVTRGFFQTRVGGIGYLSAQGQECRSTPIICIHSSPRSSDEFLEVLPLLAANRRRVVAIDIPGYGVSENPRGSTLTDVTNALIEVADSLLLSKFVVMTSLELGNVLALSLATRFPDRVVACIFANPLKLMNSKTAKPTTKDDMQLYQDGSHLLELHQKSAKWLDPELNLRVVQTNLTHLINCRRGGVTMHDICSTFDFDNTATLVSCPVLCIRGEAAMAYLDSKGLSGSQRLEKVCRLTKATVQTLMGPGSTIHMINQAPEDFASMSLAFLESNHV